MVDTFKAFSLIVGSKYFFTAAEEMRVERTFGCDGTRHACHTDLVLYRKGFDEVVYAHHLNNHVVGDCDGTCEGRIHPYSFFTMEQSA